jgi:hypothetical protein
VGVTICMPVPMGSMGTGHTMGPAAESVARGKSVVLLWPQAVSIAPETASAAMAARNRWTGARDVNPASKRTTQMVPRLTGAPAVSFPRSAAFRHRVWFAQSGEYAGVGSAGGYRARRLSAGNLTVSDTQERTMAARGGATDGNLTEKLPSAARAQRSHGRLLGLLRAMWCLGRVATEPPD